MSEVEFYKDNEVSVTNARFLVSGVTYAMSGITSVTKLRHPAKKSGAIWTIIIGIIFLFFSGALFKVSGFLLIALGIWIFTQLKDDYIVILKSASGESEALTSRNEAYIDTVISALNDSLIHRG